MEFDWIILAVCVTVLLVPGSLLYPAVVKERLTELHRSDFRVEQMLMTWQNWLDLGRALVAGFYLVHSPILSEASMNHGWVSPVLSGVILGLAIAAQTVHYRKVFYFTAPVFFIWGTAMALAGFVPALFAIVFSSVLTRLINHIELKFPLMAMILGVAGYLLNGLSLDLAVACALIPIPLVLTYISMDSLLCFSRDLATE